MIFRKTLHIFFTSLLCFMLMSGNGIAGLTIGEERELGEKLLYMIRTEFSLIDDPDITQYVTRLGQKVLANVGSHYFDYHFFVVPSDQFNAFAAPSGLIFFYSGLIETMKNENEFLSVMAHEIGHVQSRHISSRSDKNTKVSAISMALALASLAVGDPSLAMGMFTGFQAAGQAAGLHFSRVDEEQSDRLSYDWMHAMHRDPQSMEDMLRTMRRITRYRSDKIPPYLLTHPDPEARMEYVQSLIDYQGSKVPHGYYQKIDNFDFRRMKHRVMVAASDPQKAKAFFSNILSFGKDEDERMMATYGLAILQAKEFNFTKGLEELAKVQSYFPGRSILDVDAGIMYLDSGNTERAIELFKSAVNADPYDMYAVFYLAQAYSKTGKAADAEQLYRKVMKIMPEYPKVYFELGRIKSGQGFIWESNFYLAKYYLYEGKLDYAREYLKKVISDPASTESIRTEAEELLDHLDELEKT